MAYTLPDIKFSAITAVSPAFPAKVFYAAMQVHAGVNSTGTSTYVYFPLPQNFAGKTVVSAKVRLRVEGTIPGALDLYIQRHASAVAYSKMTYNNRPSQMSGAAVVTGTQVGTSTFLFDVTDEMQDVANGDAYYGWRIISDDATQRYIAVRNFPPVLELVLSNATPQPDEVRPGGTVSSPAPIFTWDAPDDITKVQLQIDAVDGDFTSPDFDTGDVVTILGQVDTDAEGWSGLAGGASADVRVRQYQTDSGWSAWSEPVTITYEAIGSLVLTSPTSPSPDPTPTYGWTFADQASWQLIEYWADGSVKSNSGRRAGTDNDYQPPATDYTRWRGPSVGSSISYVLRVWDDVDDRVSAPGAPSYAQVTGSWTFTPFVGIDPAEDLAVTQIGRTPQVELTWTRPAGIPDEWVILANGRVIDRFDGEEGHDGGNWTWQGGWTIPPNTLIEYKIAPVITGSGAGDWSDPVEFATDVTGLWVVDPEDGTYFSLAGDDVGSGLRYVDSSVIYRPPASAKPIKRTMALGGLTGEVRGTLDEYDGRTVAEQAEDLMLIRSNPAAVHRVIWGNENIPALVTNPGPVIASDFWADRDRREVTLQVDQVGEFPAVI